jgi:hypothetical protein
VGTIIHCWWKLKLIELYIFIKKTCHETYESVELLAPWFRKWAYWRKGTCESPYR